ncbi:MAG: enoyl-CoA hydratase/isomerase family protein [Paludibacter sp.]
MLFADYQHRYQTLKLERSTEGILQISVHTDGGPLRWGPLPHEEWPRAFHDIGSDTGNRVIILTGTGAEFSGPRPDPASRSGRSVERMDTIIREGRRLLANLLAIEAPMISAINGPALRHSEIPLLSDIVLASSNASFEDAGHFDSGLVPGDGVNIVYPALLGLNRGRYFLLTSQRLDAQEAEQLGLVNEVLAPEALLPRAWELARQLARHPDMHLRNTRQVLTMEIRKRIESLLGESLLLEGLANLGRT